jgi:hypothetical protein
MTCNPDHEGIALCPGCHEELHGTDRAGFKRKLRVVDGGLVHTSCAEGLISMRGNVLRQKQAEEQSASSDERLVVLRSRTYAINARLNKVLLKLRGLGHEGNRNG